MNEGRGFPTCRRIDAAESGRCTACARSPISPLVEVRFQNYFVARLCAECRDRLVDALDDVDLAGGV